MSDMIPKIVYGTAWKKERTADLVYAALKAGFRGIDTACQPKHYREDLVGQGVQRAIKEGIVKREELWLQTKYTSIDGQDQSQPLPYDPKSGVREQVRASVAKSLENLGVERIDSVVLHSPLRRREDTLEAYQTLESLVDEKKIWGIGVSNIYDKDELSWLIKNTRYPINYVQNRWYEGNGWDWDVYDLCQEHNIAYQSFWTLTGSPTLLAFEPLQKLAKKHKITPEQTLYRCCELWNITPLCGSTNDQHMREALDAEKAFGPDEPEVKVIWRSLREARNANKRE